MLAEAPSRVPVLRPRSWQREVLAAWEEGHKHLVVGVHRCAGKSVLSLTLVLRGRRGPYAYVASHFDQGRRSLWDGLDHEGWRLPRRQPVTASSERRSGSRQASAFAHRVVRQQNMCP